MPDGRRRGEHRDLRTGELRPRWGRVQEIFSRALELPEPDRLGFVEGAAGEDEVLAEEVLSLLRAHEEEGPLEELQARLPTLRFRPSVADLAGRRVLHYDLVEKLDGGGMSVVYKAQDSRLGRAVALKFLLPQLVDERDAKERFLFEAKAAASLDHPNLCTIHEVGETQDGLLFIAMAYYDGESLRRRVRRGRIPVGEALSIASQICQGLARAAEHGIIHRDIKPANVMFAADGTVKIVDFGLAKVRGGERTKSGALMGTVAYMSPEQARGEELDPRTDIWSTGVVLYQMLSGQRPFTGRTDHGIIQAILVSEPPPLLELVPDLPPAVAALVERTLEKDPAHRHPDAASLLSDIECLMEDPDDFEAVSVRPRLPSGGERRSVTVLSGVVSGVDRLLDTAEPAQVQVELARLRARVESVVEDYGGLVHEFSEHNVTALFGIPVAHEDDGVRAVRSALELVRAAGGESPVEEPLSFRFAVGNQYVPVRRADDGYRRYRIGGSVISDTALMAVAAPAGEVLIAPTLQRAVAPFLETEERPPIVLRPDRPPVVPRAIRGDSEAGSRFEWTASRGLSPFVGRAGEMGTLLRASQAVRDGDGRLVSIVGEAGVGKSRIVHEFRGFLAEEGIRYAQGRCQSHGRLAPFLPFIECARVILGFKGSGLIDAEKLQARAAALHPDLEAYAPIIQHLVAPEQDDGVLGAFTADEQAAAAVEVLTSLFTLGAGGQPLVILLEDWHWADQGSSRVIAQLDEVVSAYPVLVVVTSREPVLPGALPEGGHSRLDIHPLDRDSATALVQSALGGVRVEEGLSKHIESRTVGNPFFIEELCEHLIETHGLVVEHGRARLVDEQGAFTIPDTVQSVLKTRLDRLDPESREVLRTASVIGREFEAQLLRRVVPSPSRLDGALKSLRSCGLVQQTSMLPEPRYRFKHALTLDVAYASLLERQRRERHGLVGHALEDLNGERLDEVLETLARHFAKGHEWTKAVDYGIRAAARADRLWRWEDALATLNQAEDWISQLGSEDERRRTLRDTLLLKEEYLGKLNRSAEQAETLDRLESLVGEDPTPARAAVLARRVVLCTGLDRLEEARATLQELMAIADSCGAEEERAQALRGMGMALRLKGRDEEARAPLEGALEHSRTVPRLEVMFRDLWMLGGLYQTLGDYESALEIGRELMALEPQCTPLEQGMVYHYMGGLHRALGQYDKALEAFMASGETHKRLRLSDLLPVRISMHHLTVATARAEAGDIEGALKEYEVGTDLARRGRPEHLGLILTIRADALADLNRTEEALELYREAAEVLRVDRAESVLSHTLGRWAQALEAAGNPEARDVWAQSKALMYSMGDLAGALEAVQGQARTAPPLSATRRALLGEALELARQVDDRRAEAGVRNRLGLLCWRAKEWSESCDHYAAAVGLFQALELPREAAIVMNAWGVALTSAGRLEEARPVLLRALEVHRLEHTGREGDTLAALGALAREAGDSEAAVDYYERCVERRRQSEDRAGEAWALYRLAGLVEECGAEDRARALDVQVVNLARELGDEELLARCALSGA